MPRGFSGLKGDFMSETLLTEKDIDFCLYCFADADIKKIYYFDENDKRWLMYIRECKDRKNCGKKQVLAAWPTMGQPRIDKKEDK